MDDQDRMSRELDYNAQFFTDDYEKYAWSKLFDTKPVSYTHLDVYKRQELVKPLHQQQSVSSFFRQGMPKEYSFL